MGREVTAGYLKQRGEINERKVLNVTNYLVRVKDLTDEQKEQIKLFDCLSNDYSCNICPLACLDKSKLEKAIATDSELVNNNKVLFCDCLLLVALSETWHTADQDFEINLGLMLEMSSYHMSKEEVKRLLNRVQATPVKETKNADQSI